MAEFNISGLPDDLPPGWYDARLDNVRFVKCRDGGLDLLLVLTFRGPHNIDDPTLITFQMEMTYDE